MEKEKCYKCGKILIRYLEMADTKNNQKIKLCKECGLKLVDWLKKGERHMVQKA